MDVLDKLKISSTTSFEFVICPEVCGEDLKRNKSFSIQKSYKLFYFTLPFPLVTYKNKTLHNQNGESL